MLAMLLALVLASDLVRLSLQSKMWSPQGVVLKLSDLAKQTKAGRESSLQPVTIPRQDMLIELELSEVQSVDG